MSSKKLTNLYSKFNQMIKTWNIILKQDVNNIKRMRILFLYVKINNLKKCMGIICSKHFMLFSSLNIFQRLKNSIPWYARFIRPEVLQLSKKLFYRKKSPAKVDCKILVSVLRQMLTKNVKKTLRMMRFYYSQASCLL